MDRTYIALIHKDADSDYGVTFPDFLGCVSGGDTLEEACEMAREALMLHLEGMSADGEHIPPPCSAAAALAHEDAGYAIGLIVVEALPERTEEEAQAALQAFLASDEYDEIYNTPLTEEQRLELYEPLEEPCDSGHGLKPIPADGADRTYAALVRMRASGDFGISFPDLPGCVTAGSTLEESHRMARQALALHLEGMAARGNPIPTPSSAGAVLTHPDAVDAIALTVVEALPERTEAEAPVALAEF